ncbi:adenylate/guanylate cyclase domain-containing protein [Thiospirochaeta perfilievii]|uniref:Adenylate/guanylate cyclase domain-containing protein n=1 Tax=Thiospirochaeta perfilievii TaxID=252967 RepID=A0A5C1QB30_9SPIO|nr:adenylate/guanylate cyclase domain-containing protein [Thiospirochaeta perfilievii]QEN04260.1 adenylate/guanylate cyclase domain-containing protein [Thiospirochaeta perfilievii]
MRRVNIKTSLIFWDIVTFIVVFISTYLMFEVVIKNIISNSSNSDFYEKLDSIEAEYFNSFSYLENKETLVYFDYIDDILNYSVASGINKVKYDDSIFVILTDIEGMEIKSGKKSDPNFLVKIDNALRDKIKTYASHIPLTLPQEEYNSIINRSQNEEDKNYLKGLFTINSKNVYELSRIPNINDRNRYFQILEGRAYKADNNISFQIEFNNQEYVVIIEYAKHGILTKSEKEVTYPIFIVADLSSDFFYLINKVRNTFLGILLFVFLLVVIIKLITTSKITKEIGSISKIISQEGENIRTQGLVRKKVKEIHTDFSETSTLFDSYANLHQRLNTLGEIVSGISDKELLTAVLMDSNSILDPHEEEMTVLFLDIKGFTTLTEKYQEKVFTIVNSIWVEVENVVEGNYGKINKYIGDACLIIFQEKRGTNNSSFYALKSAILILERVGQLQKELEIEFNFRVGLDFGKIVYGKTGTENNYELGVIGDTVNTAARLEAINKQYKTNLLMTETVVNKTKKQLKSLNPHLSFYKVDKVRPKGKKEPKELYTILGNNGKQSRFIGSSSYLSNNSLNNIQNIMDSFTNGISLWKTYYEAKDKKAKSEAHRLAINKWKSTLKQIKQAYLIEELPTMEKYISRIITINELEEYKANKDKWFKKDNHEIQEPSEDWIKYGYIEIEK